MINAELFTIIIIFLFMIIHFFEYTSFLSRVSGVITNSKVTGYSIQQAVFVLTRFFFVAMMPILGLIVDTGISEQIYLQMVLLSLIFASLSYFLVLLLKNNIVSYFCGVLISYNSSASFLKSIFHAERIFLCPKLRIREYMYYCFKDNDGRSLFILSALVFGVYSIGVFISFFYALRYHEYRSAIGQMSGLVNAFATILLTFFIEPKISKSIDRNDEQAISKIFSLMLGRLFGVGVLSPCVILIMYMSL